MIKIENQSEFMEDVQHLVRGGIKKCGKCGLCAHCGVAIHLGWVVDPLAPSKTPEKENCMHDMKIVQGKGDVFEQCTKCGTSYSAND